MNSLINRTFFTVKKMIFVVHLMVLSMILIDNTVFFNYLKKNSNQIKDLVGSIEILKNLMGTVIIDLNYRKSNKVDFKECFEQVDNFNKIVEIIGEGRARQQETFFNHYQDNGSVLSNTILLSDIVYEFMRSKIDTLILPFDTSKYCNKIMKTEWCQFSNIDLFVFPIINIKRNYISEIDFIQYKHMIKSSKLSICGSKGVVFHLLYDPNDNSINNYYLFVYMKDVFISKKLT